MGKKESAALYPGVGLDVGTMNLVAARRTAEGVSTRRIRDAFLDLPLNAKKRLKLGNVSFVEREDEILILGDAALETANIFGKEARRPLSAGLVSASEVDSLDVLGLLVSEVLGKPRVKNEVCYFSVPAAPIDQAGKDIIYHQSVFERIISECGYTPYATNEAMAIIFAETAKEGFSGIGCSFGSGMCNLALSLNTMEGLSFSTSRAGDWIDKGAATSVNSTQARMCATKERGIDLNSPRNREEEAIIFYYRNMISYSLDHIMKQFKSIQNKFSLPKPIPIVVSGGTSLAGGFMDLFIEIFESKRKKFPFEVSEIRPASDPLNSVAQGLLVLALQEQE